MALPHPQPRGDGHDAAGLAGPAADQGDLAEHGSRRSDRHRQQPAVHPDLERQLDHGDPFVVQRTTNGTTWTTVGTSDQPLGNTNTHGTRTVTDPTSNATTAYQYRVVAENAVGYGSGMPSMTVSSTSDALGVNAPTAPTGLAATLAGTSSVPRVNLTWQDTATTEARFLVQRSGDNGATFTQLATVGPRNGTGSVTFADTTAALNSTYVYRVATDNVAGTSAWSNAATVVVAPPAAPVILTGTAVRQGTSQRATITWSAVPSATSYVIQRSLDPTFATGVNKCHGRLGHHVHDRQHQPHRQLVLPDGCRERARSVRVVERPGGDPGAVTPHTLGL